MKLRIPCVVLLATLGPPAAAATVTIQAGVSESGGDHAPALFVQAVSDRQHVLLESFELRPFATAGVIGSRSTPGERDATLLAGGGLRLGLIDSGVQGWFVESQVLLNTNHTSALSGHVQFGHAIGYCWPHWELLVKHVSNARLKKPNHGETMVLIGYRF